MSNAFANEVLRLLLQGWDAIVPTTAGKIIPYPAGEDFADLRYARLCFAQVRLQQMMTEVGLARTAGYNGA